MERVLREAAVEECPCLRQAVHLHHLHLRSHSHSIGLLLQVLN